MTLFNTNMPLIIFFIIILEVALLFQQWIGYLTRKHEQKRLYHLYLVLFLILYNISEGFFPDQRLTFVPEKWQNFLGYGFGYVFCSYCPVYFYKTMGLKALTFHGRYGFLFVIIPLIVFYGILYPINNDILFTRKYVYIIPVLYAIVLFSTAIKGIYKKYNFNKDRILLVERLCIFFAVFPVSLTPIFGAWLGIDKWIITFGCNIGFLVVNMILMRQFVRQSKSEQDRLAEMRREIENINAAARKDVVASFIEKCIFYSLTAREIEISKLIAEGIKYKDIAEKLFISERTVAKHVQNIFLKAGVENKTMLIKALKE
ncbi:helix-turn-helix transcriptional regulator [Pedobacter sp. UYP1]|jgi:DNA-binding CsgD family transcriptional regulator|uniref:helix-turn-helix transcriptional regulator n=1 Tax=Pedobacter sp. UYP1 TaxID=1756396 RepID=UPI00339204E5